MSLTSSGGYGRPLVPIVKTFVVFCLYRLHAADIRASAGGHCGFLPMRRVAARWDRLFGAFVHRLVMWDRLCDVYSRLAPGP